MTKSFNKFKKPCFWPIFGQFSQILQQNIFSRKSSSVTHNFIWVSSTMLKFRKKINIQFQEDAWSEGQTEG